LEYLAPQNLQSRREILVILVLLQDLVSSFLRNPEDPALFTHPTVIDDLGLRTEAGIVYTNSDVAGFFFGAPRAWFVFRIHPSDP
jgi:hypothetical protein